MLYKKYTKSNLFKELEKSKAYVESQQSPHKLVVVLVFVLFVLVLFTVLKELY